MIGPGPQRLEPLDVTFAALAHPARRAILDALRAGEASVGELAEPLALSAPAVSRHLRVLEEARLIARRKDGRVHHCRLAPEPLKDAAGWLEQHRLFWEEQLGALADYVKEFSDDDDAA